MFDNKYPYTDFHELNLDWFLAEFKKVTTKMDSLEATVKEFTDFVTSYFDNLDIQEEVSKKLNELAANGILAALINDIVYNRPRSYVNLNRLGRNINTQNAVDGFIGAGAGCMVDNENYLYAVYTDDAVGTCKLIKTNLNSGISVENIVTGLHHANGACLMANGNVAFVPYKVIDGHNLVIIEVDPLTLSVIDTHNVSNEPADASRPLAIGYNSKTDKFILIDSTKFYIVSSSYEYEDTVSFDFPVVWSSVTRQGGCCYDDYIGIVTNFPNQLLCFTIDGKYSHTIYFGQEQNGNWLGEIQNISVYKNYVYAHANLTPSQHAQYSEIAFYSASLAGGGFGLILGTKTNYSGNGQIEYVIDLAGYNSLSALNKFTANGASKPFTCIEECLLHMTSNDVYLITLYNDNETDLAIQNKNFTLKAGQHKIKSLSLRNCSCVLSSILLSGHREFTPDLGNDTPDCAIYMHNSNVKLVGNSGIVNSLTGYQIYVSASNLSITCAAPDDAGYYAFTIGNADAEFGSDVRTGSKYGNHPLQMTNICACGYVTSSSSVCQFTLPFREDLTSNFQITELKMQIRDASGTALAMTDVTANTTVYAKNNNLATINVGSLSLSTPNNSVVNVFISSIKYNL